MKKVFILLFFVTTLIAQDATSYWQTWYEKSGYKETPRYKETIEYCQKLSSSSPMIQYTTFGKSPQGRDLPLLIVDKNGNFSSDAVRKTDNVVFLIQAGIHAGEIDGKDAGLMLIRDLIIFRKNISLLDHVTLLFIPIFNVDGHERFGAYNRINQNGPEEMGWRTTAQNYNLNRDYLKADAPEMHGFLKLYNEWLPEFFADCHVTDGADYQYTVTYDIETHISQDPGLINWAKKVYIPLMQSKMTADGFPIFHYIEFRKWADPASGLKSSVSLPRYSTGFTSLHNRPGLLIETHMLKDYKSRVDGTYSMLQATISVLNKEYLKLKGLIARADSITSDKSFHNKPFPLTYKETGDSTMVDFLGYKYTVKKSDLSGGNWIRYSKNDTTFKLALYDSFTTEKTTNLPEAYIIPVEWKDIIDRLKLHGVHFSRLKESQKIKINSYKFSNVKWKEKPYENHHNVTFDMQEITDERTFPAGSAIVPMNQSRAKIIAHILEPEAPDSYVFWGFFDPIFEKKEYAENYVMEEMARFMLAGDDSLSKAFEEKKANDKKFADDPEAILNWFYQRSPYYDKKLNVYPVGKIFNSNILNNLLK